MGELWDTAGTGQGHGDFSTRHTRAPGHPKGAQGLQNALGGARHSAGQGMEGRRAAPSMACGVNATGSKSPVPPSRVSARPRCAPLAHSRTPGPVLLLPGKCGVAVMEHRDPAWDNDDPWPSFSSSSSPGFPAAPPASLAPCRSRRAAPSLPRVGSTSPPGFVCSRCASVPFIALLVLPRGSSSMLLVSLIHFPCAESSPMTFSKVPGGHNNPSQRYGLGEEGLERCAVKKELGMLVYSLLNTSPQK